MSVNFLLRFSIFVFRLDTDYGNSVRMHRPRWLAVIVAAASILLLAGVSGAQAPTPGGATPGPVPPTAPVPPSPATPLPQPPPAKEEEREAPRPPVTPIEAPRVPEQLLPSRTPTAPGPRVFVGPDLFNPPVPQGWLTLTPSLTVGGEYNDNINLTPRNRRHDEILRLIPALTLSLQQPDYRLLAGYHTSGEYYLEDHGLSNFGKTQQFFTDLFYDVSPRVRFTLNDQFLLSANSNSVTSAGVAVGRHDTLTNILTSSLRWQATPSTGLSLTGSYYALRYLVSSTVARSLGLEDSDTYRGGLTLDHRLTQRLTGTLNGDVGYLDVRHEPRIWTYTPTLGFIYDVTPTLRASARGGAALSERKGTTTTTPAASALLAQTFRTGSLVIGYDRSVTAQSIGAADTQVIFASLVLTIVRTLLLEVTPRYSMVDTSSISGSNTVSGTNIVKTATVTVQATYQLARNISAIGAYTFFEQTQGGNSRVPALDQNRAFLGLQYAFPINFF